MDATKVQSLSYLFGPLEDVLLVNDVLVVERLEDDRDLVQQLLLAQLHRLLEAAHEVLLRLGVLVAEAHEDALELLDLGHHGVIEEELAEHDRRLVNHVETLGVGEDLLVFLSHLFEEENVQLSIWSNGQLVVLTSYYFLREICPILNKLGQSKS